MIAVSLRSLQNVVDKSYLICWHTFQVTVCSFFGVRRLAPLAFLKSASLSFVVFILSRKYRLSLRNRISPPNHKSTAISKSKAILFMHSCCHGPVRKSRDLRFATLSA